jgi:adenylate cyclase
VLATTTGSLSTAANGFHLMARRRIRRAKTVRQILEDRGFESDVIDEAEQAGTSELVAIDALVLTDRPRYTLDQLAEKVDADPEIIRVFWRMLGFVEPVEDERIFTKTDIRILNSLGGLIDAGILDPVVSLQMARVLGQTMAQLATAVVDATEAQAIVLRDADDDERSLAILSEELLPFLSDAVDYSFRRHLRAAARRRVDLSVHDDGASQVIGFADLVRFTELSLQLAEDELASVVGRFDELVHSVVVEYGGRIVKMIGDAAMFTVIDPVGGAVIALELAAAVEADPSLGGIRIGMASGPIINRDGDLYGPVVNLASRLVGIGRSGVINVSQELRDGLRGDPRFRLRSLGHRNLRHIGETRVFRLRPGISDEPDPST